MRSGKDPDICRVVVRLTLRHSQHGDIITMLENAENKGKAIVEAIRNGNGQIEIAETIDGELFDYDDMFKGDDF